MKPDVAIKPRASQEDRRETIGSTPNPLKSGITTAPMYDNAIIDTTALARLVLDLPKGQTPGLARLVQELRVNVESAPPPAS